MLDLVDDREITGGSDQAVGVGVREAGNGRVIQGDVSATPLRCQLLCQSRLTGLPRAIE